MILQFTNYNKTFLLGKAYILKLFHHYTFQEDKSQSNLYMNEDNLDLMGKMRMLLPHNMIKFLLYILWAR